MSIPRTFSNILNPGHATPAFEYIWDNSILTTGGNQILTGAFRAFSTTDISNTSISVSGLSLTVGSVAVTGAPVVTLTGNTSVIIPYTNPVYVTGSFATNSSATAITGSPNVTINGGFVGITGSLSGVLTLGTGDSITVANPVLATSGIATILSLPTQNVAVTGGSILTIVTGTVNSSVTIGAVAITGFNSGSALGNLDVSKTFLNVNSVGGFVGLTGAPVVTITGILATTASVTVGNIAITGFNSTIAPLAVSGIFSATIGNVAVTGGNINTVSSAELSLLSGITGQLYGLSGQLAANLAGSAPISGDVRNIPGTAFNVTGYINTIVTGSISSTISNPIGVTGTSTDRNAFYTGAGQPIWSYLSIGGRAVNASGAGSVTGYATGANVIANFDANNGALLVEQGALVQGLDNVTVWASNTGTGPATTVSGLLSSPYFGVTLPNNPARRGWFINMISTGVALVKMSATIPNTGTFDILLKGASSLFAGDGASYSDSPAVYTGPVSITGLGGAPIVWRAWEL